MELAVKAMMQKYKCSNVVDYENAFKEVVQECILYALSQTDFFTHAAFSGGTALRIHHQLDRFSEDLDFSLLRKDSTFRLDSYFSAVHNQLAALGFDVTLVAVQKKEEDNPVQSAFLRANSRVHLIQVGLPEQLHSTMHRDSLIKIKFEIDCDPPILFDSEICLLENPILANVRVHTLPELFAGKVAALLFRPWQMRIKGRDWYDFLWYIRRGVPVHLQHLRARVVQNKGYESTENPLTLNLVKSMIREKIATIDIEGIKADVGRFIRHKEQMNIWGKPLFEQMLDKLTGF